MRRNWSQENDRGQELSVQTSARRASEGSCRQSNEDPSAAQLDVSNDCFVGVKPRFQRKGAKAQGRKESKNCNNLDSLLCVTAPLRLSVEFQSNLLGFSGILFSNRKRANSKRARERSSLHFGKDPSLARRASVWSLLSKTCSIAIVFLIVGASFACAAPDDVEAVKQDEQQINVQFFQMDENNFDANVFQPSGNAKAARTQIETKLKLQLDELQRVCGITEAQKQKLTLAASSDIKRFFDDVDRIRKKVKAGKIDQNAWNNIWQEIQPLRNKQTVGLFGDTSFFAKTVRKTLSEEQIQKYDVVVNERRKFRYRATLEVVVTNLASTVPLRHSQHEAIVKLLLDETQPPPTFGQYDQYLVMYQLGKLAEPKLKPLLEEHQWKLLQGQIQQFKGMEPFLIQNGLIPKEDEELKARVTVKKRLPALDQQADADEPENRTREKPVPFPDP